MVAKLYGHFYAAIVLGCVDDRVTNITQQCISNTCFVITGDWNANLREGGNSLFAKHMVQLCDDNGFILSSKVLLPADSFTHVSEAWGSVSWLDHIVSSSDFHNCIKTVSIDHDLSDADHIPVRLDISLDDIPGTSSSDEGSYRRLCWDICRWSRNIVIFHTSSLVSS